MLCTLSINFACCFPDTVISSYLNQISYQVVKILTFSKSCEVLRNSFLEALIVPLSAYPLLSQLSLQSHWGYVNKKYFLIVVTQKLTTKGLLKFNNQFDLFLVVALLAQFDKIYCIFAKVQPFFNMQCQVQ